VHDLECRLQDRLLHSGHCSSELLTRTHDLLRGWHGGQAQAAALRAAAGELAAMVSELQDLWQPLPELLEAREALCGEQCRSLELEAGKLKAELELAQMKVGGGWGWRLGMTTYRCTLLSVMVVLLLHAMLHCPLQSHTHILQPVSQHVV
jgi:hypothetical protein